MARPRQGIGFEQHGTVYTGVRVRGGKRVVWPVAETDPPPAGIACSVPWAKAVSLARQAAYDAGRWTPGQATPAATASEPAPPPDGPPTVLAHLRAWAARQTYGCAAEDAQRVELYLAGDELGAAPVPAVTEAAMAAYVARLRARVSGRGGTLAPRTVRTIYDVVRRGLAAAGVAIRLPRKALPALADKHAEFRPGAAFAREEALALCSDPGVPLDRRALYALLFLSGCRFGEVAALRWRHYAPGAAPLGRLTVALSIERRSRAEKSTKSGVARAVPVHPTLAAVLAHWRAAGWPAYLGRAPGADDYILPSRLGRARGERQAHARLQEDLARLGLRARRVHDTRTTFITLCIDDGARHELLKHVTHGIPMRDMMNVYSAQRIGWATYCAEVARLAFPLPAEGFVTGSVTDGASATENPKKSSGGGRIRTRGAGHGQSPTATNPSAPPSPAEPPATPAGRFVTGSVTAVTLGPGAWLDALDALDGYPADGPERALAAQLIARALRGEGDVHAN